MDESMSLTNRRRFLASAPVGLAGALIACGKEDGESVILQSQGATPASASAGAPRPLKPIPADAPVLRYIPKHDELCYTFGGVPPRHRISPGTRIVSWTEDCFDGAVKTTKDLATKVMTPGHDNPQTGPFYIEGAEPGDTVAVHLIKVEPARDYAISAYFPGFGLLVSAAMLAPDLPETTWVYRLDADRKTARTTSRDGRHSWSVPLAPFLGCLGVAPAANEARSSVVPGPFGGNMDCWEVRPGNTLFLGVNVPGALLSFGDGHYAMGEGEIIGTAIEGAMNVEVYVELLKQTATPVPRIENADEIMFVASERPVEDAARIAFKAMVGWVRDKTGMAEMDAYQFVSQATRAPIVQLVDPEYTVMVKLEKRRLPT
jgi:acetamidase/formamidase